MTRWNASGSAIAYEAAVRASSPARHRLYLQPHCGREPEGGTRIEDYIRAAIEMLATFPGLGVATDEEDVRRMPIGRFPYTVFYQIDEAAAQVRILRVTHAARVRDLGKLP